MGIIFQTKVKTRKDHICWGCAENFPKGSDLEVVKQSDGGKAFSIYWCEDCAFVSKNDDYGDDYGLGDLRNADPAWYDEILQTRKLKSLEPTTPTHS